VTRPAPIDAPTRFRDIAYVPQDPATTLYKSTVESEIEDVLQGTGRDGTVSVALAEWNLEAFASRDARDLSVGERQRTALAALLAGAPRLILLDEPTRGMDAGAKELLVSNLKRRAREGACVVVASHDVELAAAFAQRVILLSEGELVADEPVREALTGNIAFSTQASKLFGAGVLTVEDAIAHVRGGAA
jgi:energy-coupling factor transport system ATP-binding protein